SSSSREDRLRGRSSSLSLSSSSSSRDERFLGRASSSSSSREERFLGRSSSSPASRPPLRGEEPADFLAGAGWSSSGTETVSEQLGHLTRLPANSSRTRILRSQWSQLNSTGTRSSFEDIRPPE